MPTTTITAEGASTTPSPPRNWLQRRLLDPFLSLLKAGLSPASLALTVAVGAALGIAPIVGLTTGISLLVALRLRLNVAASQLVVHLLSPVQLLLLLPLLRYGASLLGHGDEVAGLTLKQLEYMLRHDLMGVLRLLWRAELGALLLWAILAMPLAAALYFGLKPVFQRFVRKQEDAEIASEVVAAAE